MKPSFVLVLILTHVSSTLAAPVPLPFLDGLVDGAKNAFNGAKEAFNGAKDIVNGATDTLREVVEDPTELINTGSGNREATTDVPPEEISKITTIAQFARAAYCSAPAVTNWTCGDACLANPDTKPILAGGDDGDIPGFFVAFDPPSNSIVVACQGTKSSDIDSVVNSIDFLLDDPSDSAFPGAKKAGAQLHGGFQATFERFSQPVLEAVKTGIAEFNATNVILTGHSLGAAISVLHAMFLPRHFDETVNFKVVTFGLPRTGNSEWAAFIADAIKARNIDFTFMTNGADPVPKLPPDEAGFSHPPGEFFQNKGVIVSCPGRENENCSAGTSLLDSNVDDHKGPYAGVGLGADFCSL